MTVSNDPVLTSNTHISAQEGAICLFFKSDVKHQQERLFSSAVELVDTIERIKISLKL